MNLLSPKLRLSVLLLLWSLSTITPVKGHEDHKHRHERNLKEGNIFDKEHGPGSDSHSIHDEHSDKEHEDLEIGEPKGDDEHDHSLCGIADPSVDEIADMNQLVSEYKEGSRGDFRINVTVPICFHVIMTTSGAGSLSDAQLQLQVDALNVHFSSTSCCDSRFSWCQTGTCSSETGFRFVMRNDCTTRTVNNDWYDADTDTSSDTAMKQSLRVGGPDVLNVYFQDLPGGLVGSSWFPWWIDDRLWRDGINMKNTAIIGGTYPGRVKGGLFAHEVGHWLGVYHTFQWGCSPNEGVMDTNPESSAARECPIGRDTCSGGDVGNGADPIHNFMDYTNDECMFEFTQDQIDVMHVSHAVFRAERVTRNTLVLEDGVMSEPLTLAEEEFQTYRYRLGASRGPVYCVASYIEELTGQLCTSNCFNGDAQLYLRWGAPPLRFGPYDCGSQAPGSFESCTTTPRLGDRTLFVGLYAEVTFLDVVTVCYSGLNFISLANNTASPSISLVPNETQYFKFPVVSRAANVTCFSTCDNGNADMYMSLNYVSHLNGMYVCSSTGTGSIEECSAVDVREEVVVAIVAVSSFNSLTVTCFEIDLGTIVLRNAIWSSLLSLSTGEEQPYRFPLGFPDLPGTVTCNLAGPNGDADFVLLWSNPPVRGGIRDCGSFSVTSYESCALDVPVGATDLYILVYAFTSFSSLRVRCVETAGSGMPSRGPTTSLPPSSHPTTQPSFVPTSSFLPSTVPSASSAPSGVSDRRVLYGITRGSSSSSLYIIDWQSGSSTFIGLVTEASTGTALRLRCLAFDPTTNTLYGHTSDFDSSFRDYLVVLDMSTAEATLIGRASRSPMIATAFDASGQLYGWNEYDTDDLYFIDKHTGVDTLVGLSGYYLEEVEIVFDEDGILHLLNDNGAYYIVDPLSGVATYQGFISGKTIRSSHGDLFPGTKSFYQVEYSSGGRIEIVDLETRSATGTMSTGISTLYALAFASALPSSLFVPSSLPSGSPSVTSPPSLVPSSSSAPSRVSDRRVLYGTSLEPSSSSLYSIDLQGESSTWIGVVTEACTGTALRLRCLAFDPTTNILYGHTSSYDSSFRDYLVVLDVSTAEATLIGRASWSPMIAFAFDASGQLYGWNEYGTDDLYFIDKHTGVDTLVGLSGFYLEEVGIAFDADGVLHMLNDDGDYYIVDPVSGDATFLGQISGKVYGTSRGDIYPGTKSFYQVAYPVGGQIEVIDLETQSVTRVISAGTSTLHTLAFVPQTPAPCRRLFRRCDVEDECCIGTCSRGRCRLVL